MDDSDLIIARQLQEKYDKESAAFFVSGNEQIDRLTNQTKNGGSWSTHSQLSVVDPSLEISDPNPDVRALFLHFNEEYFWGRLAGVEVRWSPRMTLCAGMCHYEGRGGLCSIRLSVPLLKLRPRKDLVETLLHEMIHAFLFVADNDREREEHGPNFKKHMHRINKASGANITIYHSFHDEVDSYRQHWWRCDGPCRNRPPYYGWVKRAMNRAPSARDLWWEDHARSCGGSYTKVKEPEGYGAKKTGAKEQKKDKGESKGKNKDIRSFFGDGQILGVSTPKKTGTTSGVNKKPTSTVTASGSSSSSPTTIPHATNNTHTNSNIPSGQEMDDDFPMDAFWGGGIWADELDNIPELSSDTPSENSDISTGVPSNQQKNWTVVETKNDREVRLNSGASDSKSEKLKGAGQVLGQGSGEGESWLAKLRKQWAQETKTSKSPSRISDKKNAGDKTKQADSHFKKTVSAKNKSGTETKPTETDDFEIPDALIFSDDSHHSSFHVSSCEEDSWPSPESYKTKHKHSKASSGKELHRKRSVMDLVSSDKDDFDVPGVSKRAKSASDSSRSKGGKQQDLGLSNSSQQRNMKISSKDKGGSQRNQKINGGDAVRSGTEASIPSLGADANHNFGESSGRNEDDVSLVPCPVCQRKVAADDINRHLDECLS